MKQLDPVSLEILWNRLIAIVDEAAAGFVRTSFSSLVREANDYAVVLTDAQGRSLAQSSLSIPSFISTLPKTVGHFLDSFPAEQLDPGDVLITNDPWMGTGHIHDVSTAMPIHYRGRLVAFSAITSHMPDIGGPVRTNDNSVIYEEGLQIPQLKLMRGGEIDPSIQAFIRQDVRVPDQTMGDLFGQVAAHKMLAARLAGLLEEVEVSLEALGEEIRGRSEAALRRAIRALPDGVYNYVAHHDGFASPLVIDCTVRVLDDELEVDYAGTSPQVVDKAINVVPAYTYAYTAFPLKALLSPSIPNNEGSFAPIRVTAPEGSVLHATWPAATAARGQVGHILPTAVLGALAPVVPGGARGGQRQLLHHHRRRGPGPSLHRRQLRQRRPGGDERARRPLGAQFPLQPRQYADRGAGGGGPVAGASPQTPARVRRRGRDARRRRGRHRLRISGRDLRQLRLPDDPAGLAAPGARRRRRWPRGGAVAEREGDRSLEPQAVAQGRPRAPGDRRRWRLPDGGDVNQTATGSAHRRLASATARPSKAEEKPAWRLNAMGSCS